MVWLSESRILTGWLLELAGATKKRLTLLDNCKEASLIAEAILSRPRPN